MTEYSLQFGYTLPVSSSSFLRFFRIEREVKSTEPPTVEKAARAIDKVIGQDYCNRSVSHGGFSPPEKSSPAVQRQDFASFISNKLSDPLVALDFASDLGLDVQCRAENSLPVEFDLFVFWQTEDDAESYRLVSTGDVEFSTPKIRTEVIEKEFTVSESEELNIEYYILIKTELPLYLQIEFEWIGNVVNEDKDVVSGPSGISIKDNSIVRWDVKVSGSFRIKFTTKYHSVTAKVKPVSNSVIVYGVWSGPEVKIEIPLEIEDKDACPLNDLINGNIDNFTDTKIVDPEKDELEGVGESVIPNYTGTDPYGESCEPFTGRFEDACCRAPEPGEPIPPCVVIKSIYNGGAEIEKGREYWEKKYPGGVVFHPKLPKEGFCGEKTIRFEYDGDCCVMPRLIFTKIDNQTVVKQDGNVIWTSEWHNVAPSGPDNVYYVVFLAAGATVKVEHYNYSGAVQTWCLKYTYRIGEVIIDTVDKTDESNTDAPVFTRDYKVCR